MASYQIRNKKDNEDFPPDGEVTDAPLGATLVSGAATLMGNPFRVNVPDTIVVELPQMAEMAEAKAQSQKIVDYFKRIEIEKLASDPESPVPKLPASELMGLLSGAHSAINKMCAINGVDPQMMHAMFQQNMQKQQEEQQQNGGDTTATPSDADSSKSRRKRRSRSSRRRDEKDEDYSSEDSNTQSYSDEDEASRDDENQLKSSNGSSSAPKKTRISTQVVNERRSKRLASLSQHSILLSSLNPTSQDQKTRSRKSRSSEESSRREEFVPRGSYDQESDQHQVSEEESEEMVKAPSQTAKRAGGPVDVDTMRRKYALEAARQKWKPWAKFCFWFWGVALVLLSITMVVCGILYFVRSPMPFFAPKIVVEEESQYVHLIYGKELKMVSLNGRYRTLLSLPDANSVHSLSSMNTALLLKGKSAHSQVNMIVPRIACTNVMKIIGANYSDITISGVVDPNQEGNHFAQSLSGTGSELAPIDFSSIYTARRTWCSFRLSTTSKFINPQWCSGIVESEEITVLDVEETACYVALSNTPTWTNMAEVSVKDTPSLLVDHPAIQLRRAHAFTTLILAHASCLGSHKEFVVNEMIKAADPTSKDFIILSHSLYSVAA